MNNQFYITPPLLFFYSKERAEGFCWLCQCCRWASLTGRDEDILSTCNRQHFSWQNNYMASYGLDVFSPNRTISPKLKHCMFLLFEWLANGWKKDEQNSKNDLRHSDVSIWPTWWGESKLEAPILHYHVPWHLIQNLFMPGCEMQGLPSTKPH